MTFYCLKFETPPTWRARYPYLYPQEQGDPVITPGTGFSFRRFPQLTRLRWRYSNPPPHGVFSCLLRLILLIYFQYAPHRKHHFKNFVRFCVVIRFRGNIFALQLPSSECLFRSAIPVFFRNTKILFYLINDQLYDKYIALKLQSSAGNENNNCYNDVRWHEKLPASELTLYF
jgi:hypothetical protein